VVKSRKSNRSNRQNFENILILQHRKCCRIAACTGTEEVYTADRIYRVKTRKYLFRASEHVACLSVPFVAVVFALVPIYKYGRIPA